MKVKEVSEEMGLKLNMKKTIILTTDTATSPRLIVKIPSWEIIFEFFFNGPSIIKEIVIKKYSID